MSSPTTECPSGTHTCRDTHTHTHTCCCRERSLQLRERLRSFDFFVSSMRRFTVFFIIQQRFTAASFVIPHNKQHNTLQRSTRAQATHPGREEERTGHCDYSTGGKQCRLTFGERSICVPVSSRPIAFFFFAFPFFFWLLFSLLFGILLLSVLSSDASRPADWNMSSNWAEGLHSFFRRGEGGLQIGSIMLRERFLGFFLNMLCAILKPVVANPLTGSPGAGKTNNRRKKENVVMLIEIGVAAGLKCCTWEWLIVSPCSNVFYCPSCSFVVSSLTFVSPLLSKNCGLSANASKQS